MKKLLLTGSAGFLGWNVRQLTQNQWNYIGIHHKNKPSGLPSYALDLTNPIKVNQTLAAIQPDAILHLAAISSVGYCQKNPTESYAINVQATQYLATYCQAVQIPFIFTSSEQVFDGKKPSYVESDLPNPINAYGKQKAAAEAIVQSICPNACIARIAVLYGQHDANSYCFMTDWLEKLKAHQPITVFTDEIRTFLSGRYAAEALFFLLENEAKGIFNISGGSAISRYDFANLLSEAGKIKAPNIVACSQKDLSDLAATRPERLNLNIDKLISLGGPKPIPIKQELARLITSC